MASLSILLIHHLVLHLDPQRLLLLNQLLLLLFFHLLLLLLISQPASQMRNLLNKIPPSLLSIHKAKRLVVSVTSKAAYEWWL